MRVRVVSEVRIGARRGPGGRLTGGRILPVKRVTRVAPILPKSAIEATSEQLRVIAEESRELLIDKIMAGVAAPPGRRVVARPPRLAKGKGVYAQRVPFPRLKPLTRRHVLRKARWHLAAAHTRGFRGDRRRLDGRFFVLAGDYVNNIQVLKTRQKESGVSWMLRLAPRKHKPVKGWGGKPITLQKLAGVLENGRRDRTIPRRPHWRPTMREVRQTFLKQKRTVQAAHLRGVLRRLR